MQAGNHPRRAWVVWAALSAFVAAPIQVALGQSTQSTGAVASAPGRTVAIKVVGPDGQPLTGVVAHNLTALGSQPTKPSASAELNAVAPKAGKTRLIWFAHETKRLAGALTISGDSTGPYTAKLAPWAIVTGRLVGGDKKPRSGLAFHVQASETPTMLDAENVAYWQGPVGSDGSFRVEGIVPGLATKTLIIETELSLGHSGPRLKLKPGESVDLGTIVSPKPLPPDGPNRIRAGSEPPKPLELAKFEESKANVEYKTDFRKEQYDLRWLKIDGPGGAARLIRPDKRGLRFTVPAGLGEGATVATKFGVAGDFEITGTFEALSSERPNKGWGMGPELLIKPPGGWDKFASAGRFVRTEQTVYSLVHGSKVGNEPKFDAGTIPTGASSGRFRLVRTGPTLHFQVAEGESPTFRELFATEYGTEPIEFVRLAAVTGGSQKAVDVLWKDLTIRAEDLPGFASPTSGPSRPARSPLWLVVGAVGVFVLVAVVWWWAAAHRPVASGTGDGPAGAHEVGAKHAAFDAWDEESLTRMEEAAMLYAQGHPGATSCGQRSRFRFTLRQGVLHGPFIAWKPVDSEEDGTSGYELHETLLPLFEGSYHQGKRQGTFAYHDDEGHISTRRYRDGRVAG